MGIQQNMTKHWYKILASVLIVYTIFAGLLNPVPRLDILNETIRNLYYHVPVWFAMIFMMIISLVYSLISLSNSAIKSDLKARDAAAIGFFMAIPGIATGSLWAKYTWGTWWTFEDPKLNGVAVSILIYSAYFILRESIEDEKKRLKLAAVYNVFAFVMMMVFIMVLPRIQDSLHPGNGGNPAFAKYDLDSGMRLVFYPAVIGWVLFSYWLFNLKNNLSNIQHKLSDE